MTAAWSDPGHRHPGGSRSSFTLSVEQGCFKRTRYLHRLSSALPRHRANPRSGLEDTRTAVWTTSIPQTGAEPLAPLQDTQPLPPPDPSVAGAGKPAAQRAQGRVQLAALPAPAQPFPQRPTRRRGSAGAKRDCFGWQILSKGIRFAQGGHPTSPARDGNGRSSAAAAQPGTGTEGALAPRRGCRSSRGSPRRGKLGSAGRWTQELAAGLLEPGQPRLEAVTR